MRKWIAFTLALCVIVGSMASLGCHPRHHRGGDHGYSQQYGGGQDSGRHHGHRR